MAGKWERSQAIYFEKIKQGLDSYANEIIVMGEEEAFCFFFKKLKEAREGSVYVDFYYCQLEEGSRQAVEKELTKKERAYVRSMLRRPLEEMAWAESQVIYAADEELLKIIAKLNGREVLFSTVYFLGDRQERSAWWGNYGHQYIVFREKTP